VHLPVTDELDPAQRSLADALRVSFALLQIIMVILFVVYLASNFFNVGEDQVAVRVRFGKIVGEGDERIIGPGGPHFTLPFPIDTVVKVSTGQQTLALNDAFWFEMRPGDAGKTTEEIAQGRQGPLNPEKDGSLITGDANLAHARWTVSYRIGKRPDGSLDPAAVINFLKNVGGPKDEQALQQARAIVRAAAEQAIVFTAAQMSLDDVYARRNYAQVFTDRIRAILSEMNAGIFVQQVTLDEAAIPFSVRDAYQAVINAENTRARKVNEAQKYETQTRTQTVGGAAVFRALWPLIDRYEVATRGGDPAAIAAADAALKQAFDHLETPPPAEGAGTPGAGPGAGAGLPISGEASSRILAARAYRSELSSQVQNEVARFVSWYEQYQQSPELVRQRLWQQMRQEVLASKDIETLYLPPGQLYLELNRDPNVQREQEAARLQAEDQARRQRLLGR
jgi:membrane protease subunit HflK